MRYADRVTFYRESEGRYDPELSQYVEGRSDFDTLPCNVSNLGIDRRKELFGRVDRSMIVVRLQRSYDREWDYAEVNGRRYEQVSKHPFRTETAFYLEEVPVHEAERDASPQP